MTQELQPPTALSFGARGMRLMLAGRLYVCLTDTDAVAPLHFKRGNAAAFSCLSCVSVPGKGKVSKQPVYLTLGGAHGLLDQAIQMLTLSSQSKPQRR